MRNEFGSAFGPLLPPKPTKDEELGAQLALLAAEINRLNLGLEVAADDPDPAAATRIIMAPAIDASSMATEIANAVGRAVGAAMARVASAGQADSEAALVDALAEQTRHIRALGRKITASAISPSGGSSGHVIVDSGQVTLTGSEFPWSSVDRVRVDALASEATLAAVLAAVDTLEALTTDLRAEARRRPVYDVATTLLTVPAGVTYTTVVAFTPTTAITVVGYNADFKTLATAAYRMRLIVGTDAGGDANVRHGEEVNTTANSWSPVRLSIAAGTRVAVQVLHGELTAQDFRATLNYYEEP